VRMPEPGSMILTGGAGSAIYCGGSTVIAADGCCGE